MISFILNIYGSLEGITKGITSAVDYINRNWG